MEKTAMEPTQIPIDLIDPDPNQPRRKIEGLQELSTIIGEIGIIQPIAVRPHPTQTGRWMIVIGERRWRAAKMAGLTTVPAFNRADIDDSQVFFFQIVENLEDYRHPLEAHEKAVALKTWVTKVSVDEACKILGRKKDWISRETALADVSAEVWDVASTEKIEDKRTILELHRLCKHTGKPPEEEWKGLKQIGPKSREALHTRMVAAGAKKQRVKKEEGVDGAASPTPAPAQSGSTSLPAPGGTPLQIVPPARQDSASPSAVVVSPPPAAEAARPGRFKRKGLDKRIKLAGEKFGIDSDAEFEALLEKLLALAAPEVAAMEVDDAVPA